MFGRRPGQAPSLLIRLMIGAVLALVLALMLIALAVDRGFRSAAESALAERLESVVFLILSTTNVDEQGRPIVDESLAEPRLEQPGSGLHAGALTPVGEWRSPSLVGVTDPPDYRLLERGRELFQGPETGGRWHVFAMGLGWEQADGQIVDLTIWAAEDPARFRSTVSGFRGDLWRWMMLAAALLIGAQIAILVMLLKPLRGVAQDVADIEAGRAERLSGQYPRELQPLTANLNALLETERSNATHYRQALADLAHALKTPLAVIRARLDGDSPPDRAELADALDDMDRLLRRQLERAARSTRRTLYQPVSVVPLLKRLADSLTRLYAADDVQFELQGPNDLSARIDERDLMEICGNLMENAAKYGGGRVRVSVHPGPSGTRHAGLSIVIDDDGPGFPDSRLADLLQRGVRADERREGQGLGLAIAAQLIEAYDGRLEQVPSELGGAALRIHFPSR